MPQSVVERTVRQSVLDRLREPVDGEGTHLSWMDSVQRLKIAVLRDLEWLLNTRRSIEPATTAFPEVSRSLYHYGLPDISSLSGDSGTAHRRLLRDVEDAIETFEPRLTGVRVSFAEEGDGGRKLRFVIEALLKLDPDPERVVFDTVLEISSGKFLVAGREYA